MDPTQKGHLDLVLANPKPWLLAGMGDVFGPGDAIYVLGPLQIGIVLAVRPPRDNRVYHVLS